MRFSKYYLDVSMYFKDMNNDNFRSSSKYVELGNRGWPEDGPRVSEIPLNELEMELVD